MSTDKNHIKNENFASIVVNVPRDLASSDTLIRVMTRARAQGSHHRVRELINLNRVIGDPFDGFFGAYCSARTVVFIALTFAAQSVKKMNNIVCVCMCKSVSNGGLRG